MDYPVQHKCQMEVVGTKYLNNAMVEISITMDHQISYESMTNRVNKTM